MDQEKKSYIVSNETNELLIPGYPKGSDLTIINTAYIGRRKNESGKLDKDYIAILFRDNATGDKKVHIIYEPLYTFYKIKDEFGIPDHNLFFVEEDKVKPYTCKYADILRAIAEATDNEKFYFDNISSGTSSENRKLHTCPDIFFSDMNVENYYRFLFGLNYTNSPFKLSKAFLDIETDIKYCLGDFPEPGEVPVNAVAYLDEVHNIEYQFILNDPRNPNVEAYKKIQSPALMDELKQFVIKSVGGYKKAVKFGLDNMEYKIVFFDDELEMLTKMFQVIQKTAPDFILIWNMSFDLNYLLARIDELGGDILNTVTDPRIKQQFLRYYVDERNKNNYEERGDFVSISAYSVWLDQMIEFASRRKGRGRYQSFALDAIGEVVAGVNKLDYSHITNDIGMLPYLDFKTFSFYNIMDVVVQKCIEKVTQDCEYVFTKCLVNNTIYSKCHRQSVYLANRFAKDFYTNGYIIGNNKNTGNEQPTFKFPGAMVGDPLHNSKEVVVKIHGRPTLLINNAVDFDYSSLYPSIVLENNLAPNTQIGKIIIEDENDKNKTFSLNEHPDMYSSDEEVARYSRGGEFLDNLASHNILEFSRRWLGLGSVFDVIDDIREYYQYNKYHGIPIDWNLSEAVYYIKDNMIEPVAFGDYSMNINPIKFYNVLSSDDKVEMINRVRSNAIL